MMFMTLNMQKSVSQDFRGSAIRTTGPSRKKKNAPETLAIKKDVGPLGALVGPCCGS